MDKKSPLIQIKNVSKEYMLGDTLVKALDGINLEIHEGEFISILGKSGSGKSTLMHIVGLLDRPSKGELYIEDKLASTLTDNDLARIRSDKVGFVFQSFNLLSRTSALDNVLLPTLYKKNGKSIHEQGLSDIQKATSLLTRVGLGEKMKNHPNQLSGGQQQRVAIARALINDPSIILADEPTGNLDSKSGDEILTLLTELNKEGKTIIIVTHDESTARISNRIIKITDGKVVEDTLC